jgi:hypothetical protein
VSTANEEKIMHLILGSSGYSIVNNMSRLINMLVEVGT